ncbi:MAG: hypothetical protein AB7P02_06840 [Alphaproteobacteria bacterium]
MDAAADTVGLCLDIWDDERQLAAVPEAVRWRTPRTVRRRPA